MNAHTPGPWRIDTTDAEGWSVIEAVPPAEKAICLVGSTMDNAKLIAAAPDMIKALRFVGCIGNHTCCAETPCHVCYAINLVDS